jgi:hypothetical protein
MNLGDLITRLEAADPDQTVRQGFNHPHSYRGDYMDLAFEPAANITVADMLAAARSALGATYQGWKGGDFTMSEHTWCWLSAEGDASGETISGLLLDLLLAEPAAVSAVVPPTQDTPADAMGGLVPRAVRPLDIEHDELMARAAAEHEARTAADEAATAAIRAGALREAIDVAREEGHRLEAEQGIEAARGARSVAYLLRKLLAKDGPRRLAAETQQPTDADVVEAHRLALSFAVDGAETRQAVVSTADKAYALGLTDTEYRARSHAAAVATVRAAIPGMYAHVGFRLEDALNEAAETQQTETETDTAQLAKVVRWVTSEAVTAKTEFGDGYRASQRDIRDVINGRFDYNPHTPAVSAGVQTDEEAQPRQSCACGQDGCEYCDAEDADEETQR